MTTELANQHLKEIVDSLPLKILFEKFEDAHRRLRLVEHENMLPFESYIVARCLQIVCVGISFSISLTTQRSTIEERINALDAEAQGFNQELNELYRIREPTDEQRHRLFELERRHIQTIGRSNELQFHWFEMSVHGIDYQWMKLQGQA